MADRDVDGFAVRFVGWFNLERSQGEADTVKSAAVALGLLLTLVACNPFAPEFDEELSEARFGDPRTIEGYFQAFHFAYQFKDTTLYGSLLAPEFVFSYRNYDRGLELEWGREEDLRATSALFQSAQSLDLLWGNILDSISTATTYDISRAFSLEITYNPGQMDHVDGRATFHLERQKEGEPWRAVRWRDESNL